jgi:hypothetical protein
VQEGLDQHGLGLGFRNAAGAEVEQAVGIQRADRRAMAALHVVGVDLELRLAVDLGVLAQQQRLVHLVAVGLLRHLMHVDLALEHAARRPASTVL